MSQIPAPLTMTARRKKVRQLIVRNPYLSARAIADQLGVGKDTIRRDLDAIRATKPPVEPPESEDGDILVLALDDGLRQALSVLRAPLRRPDTPAENRAAARAAIRAIADTVLEAHPELAP